MSNDAGEGARPRDLQLLRAEQLHALTEEYARLWRSQANLDRIHEVERLLERLLTLQQPVEIPGWLLLGEDGPPPRWVLHGADAPPQIIRKLRELDTCVNLIDPALKTRGWIGDLVRREAHFRDKRDDRSKRIDYALWLPRRSGQQRLVALIEAKHEGLAPDHGLEQVKAYAAGRRERIPFVFSTNGRHFVQYDRRTKIQSGPYLLEHFPTPEDLAALLLTYRTLK
jgi:hypothetical protein